MVVFELKDDCSRAQIANLAWPAEDTAGAWECVARGIDAFGLPQHVVVGQLVGLLRQAATTWW